MSQTPTRPPAEVSRIGFAALCDRLGMADAIRFLQQFDLGKGDYTEERVSLFEGDTISSLMQEMKARQKRHS